MSRVAVAILVLLVLAGGGYGLMHAANSRDDSSITPSAESAGPGKAVEGSCPGTPRNVTKDGGALSSDEIRTALAQGNVVLFGPDIAALREIQEEVSGPFDSELAAAGQMVIVAKGDQPAARAFERALDGPADPAALRDFAESWLGKAAGGTCG
jgi:hypothetical protein